MDLIERNAVLAEIGEFQIRFNETGDSHERVAYASAEHCMLVIKAAPAVNRWIPCSERLPEEETDVIAVIDGCSREAFYSDSSFIGSNFYRNAEEVTYWMPKPEPPKE